MTQVSNQGELQAALTARETQIEVISDFFINSQVNITYAVTIRSASGSTFTIKKASSYFALMFRIGINGNLTLENIILDGDKQNHPMNNTSNRSLISINGGSLNLGEGSVLQNNNSYIEGGGIYVSGNVSYVNRLQMTGNATIQNCIARTNGGGVMVAVRNEQDSIIITDQAIIKGNQALNGGGIYLRGYVDGVAGLHSINESVQITNNQATSNGGGIFIQNFLDNYRNMTLNISGNVVISDNTGSNGGGIYFGKGATSDYLNIIGTLLQRNVATNGGGICAISGNVAIQGSSEISNNNSLNYGGGVSIGEDANFTLFSDTIHDNTSILGGGVYNNGNFYFKGGSIYQNSAEVGGGIYNGS